MAITICLNSVGEDNVASSNDGVVAHNLTKYRLVNLDVWLFALHNHKRLCVALYDHNVGTLCHAVDVYGILGNDLLWKDSAV